MDDMLYSQIRGSGLSLPNRDYWIMTNIRWLLDFCWPVERICVDAVGDQARPTPTDQRKAREMQENGWRYIRATDEMVLDGSAMALIRVAYEAGGQHVCTEY